MALVRFGSRASDLGLASIQTLQSNTLNSLTLLKLQRVLGGILMLPSTAGNPALPTLLKPPQSSTPYQLFESSVPPVFCPIPAWHGKSPSLIGLFVTPSHSSHPVERVGWWCTIFHIVRGRCRDMGIQFADDKLGGSSTRIQSLKLNQMKQYLLWSELSLRHQTSFEGKKHMFCSWVHLWVLVCLILGYQRPPLHFFQSPIVA